MKDHILHLDPHDDYASARDKIGWAQADRVVLVWPRYGQPLARKLDLLLLHRHADRAGAKLGFVTADPDVADLAAELGIPVFNSIEDGHLERWDYRRPVPPLSPPPGRSWSPEVDAPLFEPPLWWDELRLRIEEPARRLFFALALVAFVALALYLFPSATVTLIPASQPISLPVTLVADPAQSEVSPVEGLIPARVIEVRVQTSVSAPTSGLQEQPSTKAVGKVTFTNRRTGPVTIPKGTTVRTTGGLTVRFVTTREAITPAEQGGSVEVPVEALDAGPAGNVEAQRINAIDGTLAFQLAVVNPAPTAGGEVLTVAAVTETDQQNLRETAAAQLDQLALASAEAQLGENEFLAPDTLRIVGAPQETFSHFVGEKADSLTLDARATLIATAVNVRGAQTLALVALEERLGDGQAVIPGSVAFTRGTTVTSDEGGRVTFEIVASGQVAPVIDAGEVRALVIGRSLNAARRRLAATYDLAAPPELNVWPGVWPRMPWLAMRITVEVSQGLPNDVAADQP